MMASSAAPNNSLSHSSSPPPPPPPPSGDPPNNPWRINHPGASTTSTGSVTLIGESSSWPPLSSQPSKRRSNSPPLLPPPLPPTEIHAAAVTEPITEPIAASGADPIAATGTEQIAAAGAEQIAGTEQIAVSVTEQIAADTYSALSISGIGSSVETPTPTNASIPQRFSGNAAVSGLPRPMRQPAPPLRRGRNTRYHNHNRGGFTVRNYNGAHNSHPLMRPNWDPNLPQYPNWGAYPGSAVGGFPPVNQNLLVPYAYTNPFVYQGYDMDSYGNYYNYPRMPYPPLPLIPTHFGPPNLQVAPPSVSGLTTSPSVSGLTTPPSISGLTTPPSISGLTTPPSVSGLTTQGDIVDVKNGLLNQFHFYFSDDNLPTDDYLKRRMDFEGWVDIREIAKFRKVIFLVGRVGLVQDNCISFIKEALQPSNLVEVQGDKVRRRNDWHRWTSQQSSQSSLVASVQSISLAD